ncbi:hypothetical protein ACLQ2Q_18830 [Microbacterium sp. DT81.1]
MLLIFTAGWWWAPLALIGGFVAMLTTLARMLFAPQSRDSRVASRVGE